jgi:ABC-type uncharacterized transport system auxiliary subunit
MKYLNILVAAALVLTGCITVKVPIGGAESEPATMWILRWDAPEEKSGPQMGIPIRVKDFEAGGSYQLSGMVVRRYEGTVLESSDNRWANRPGAMLSEMLARDLMAQGNWPGVFRTATSVNEIYNLEGYLREFGAVQMDSSSWEAVLDIDVAILGSRGSEVIFHRNYRYSRAMQEPGFPELARQLSSIGRDWSIEVRADMDRILSR